ncbi:MAG: hypothetical protein UX08_C0002G0040 [Candidatus Collierbacteria bacterium GW2011_GWB1_45_35]|uniref:Uncharacterized protein n=1 Tax=Candidatus Collierbacteria bacterium GW2011_GWB2_45_17 TaxID=1618388 RepID=A0A837IIS6_9BACT|nr:MAG: hypothetical protein UW48_C0004G0050 [Microgenomates group bacterium GW2011_GWC1_44_23]KKT95726.1 MAG: hypothetical protein UW96_C0005G0050 [Candidatus Collierbacteria bacterium GW2011_GWA1_45_15]KKU00373.1 MAG: hypothetical protein UX01_C0005G0050 [Candidatus Collierbacteria bacterium GW2011_GWB2_45_17]KKU05825.1 MAG: hypothetical protein UX08_C0002G0040 [Candidatus Collierbacteria bacterium GW2011_GWB1_45_35]HCX26099.1 hypothetical protein [Candidatus Collierbacteria bacterium]
MILLSVITKFELIFGTITNLLAHRSTLRVSRFATACPAGPPLAEAEPLAREKRYPALIVIARFGTPNRGNLTPFGFGRDDCSYEQAPAFAVASICSSA